MALGWKPKVILNTEGHMTFETEEADSAMAAAGEALRHVMEWVYLRQNGKPRPPTDVKRRLLAAITVISPDVQTETLTLLASRNGMKKARLCGLVHEFASHFNVSVRKTQGLGDKHHSSAHQFERHTKLAIKRAQKLATFKTKT